MITIKSNRFIQAVLKLMLLSAVIHVAILVFDFLVSHQTNNLSFFSIVGVDLFYPNFVVSSFGQMVSYGTVIILFIIIYFFFTKSSTKNKG